MPALKRLQRSVDIAAPAPVVYQALIGPESYTKWTSTLGEGLWQTGQRIAF
jgi:uncharacterized protein YndB with AHSA1/START domain